MKQKFIIIIPVYNEEKTIAHVVSSVKKSGVVADIVIINDCSTDRTNRIISNLSGITVLVLPINLGIGGAMQTGYRYASDNNYEFAVQVDGDGQHDPREIQKLITAMKKTGADVIIGSRFVSKTHYSGSVSRRFGILIFSFVTKILIGQTIKDATSGFRLVNKKVIKYFAEYYPSDYPEPEVLIPLSKMGFKIVETSVAMNARSGGKSSITSIKSIYYMVKVIVAMFIAKMRKIS